MGVNQLVTAGLILRFCLQKGEKYEAHMDAFYDQREFSGSHMQLRSEQ